MSFANTLNRLRAAANKHVDRYGQGVIILGDLVELLRDYDRLDAEVRRIDAARQPILVQLDSTSGVAVNPSDIVTMRFDDYNGQRCLMIHLRNGPILRVNHWPGPYGGADIYKLHALLLEAQHGDR